VPAGELASSLAQLSPVDAAAVASARADQRWGAALARCEDESVDELAKALTFAGTDILAGLGLGDGDEVAVVRAIGSVIAGAALDARMKGSGVVSAPPSLAGLVPYDYADSLVR